VTTSVATNQHAGVFLVAIVTLTGAATFRISATSIATTSTVKASAPIDTSGGTLATHLAWVRLA
jgi:hypothetical protein